jgi:hypothetical protein
MVDMERYETAPGAFGAWLLTRTEAGGFVGTLAKAAKGDRRFPKQGDAEAVRKYLRQMQADGDMFDAIDDAEADWRALN